MRRVRTVLLAFAATTVVLAACDSDDGRELQTPDSLSRFQLQSTTPSTTSTVVAPTEVAPGVTASTAASTSSLPTTTAALSATSTTGAAPAEIEMGTGTNSVQFAGPWNDGEAIPVEFACDGGSNQPLIVWSAPPEGTAELAMSVVGVGTGGFVHWLIVGLPAQAGSVGGGEPLAAGTEALNSYGNPGWGAPCPPDTDPAHTYIFTLHLLGQPLELPADSPTRELIEAVEASTVDRSTFTGTYQRT